MGPTAEVGAHHAQLVALQLLRTVPATLMRGGVLKIPVSVVRFGELSTLCQRGDIQQSRVEGTLTQDSHGRTNAGKIRCAFNTAR